MIQFTRNGSGKGHPLPHVAVFSYSSLLSPIFGVVCSLLPYDTLNNFFLSRSNFVQVYYIVAVWYMSRIYSDAWQFPEMRDHCLGLMCPQWSPRCVAQKRHSKTKHYSGVILDSNLWSKHRQKSIRSSVNTIWRVHVPRMCDHVLVEPFHAYEAKHGCECFFSNLI